MTYQQFISDTIATLEPQLPAHTDIRAETIKKNNGACPNALIISEPDTNIFPTIYMDEYYTRAKTGADISSLSSEILDRYNTYKINGKIDISFFTEYEKIKDLVVYRLVNRQKNRELLNDIPWVPFLDLAVIFCLNLRSDEEITASTIIHNSHLIPWNTDVGKLFNLAKKNTKRILPMDMRTLPDFLNDMAGEIIMDDSHPETLMHILTNKSRTHGAACMMYDGVLKDFADRFECDVFILPSSIHEVILLADDNATDIKSLTELVLEVNKEQVAKEEVLSDHAYKYIRAEDRIVY